MNLLSTCKVTLLLALNFFLEVCRHIVCFIIDIRRHSSMIYISRHVPLKMYMYVYRSNHYEELSLKDLIRISVFARYD